MGDLLLDTLLEKIADKDRNALGQLYDKTSSDVFGYILSIMSNKPKSEDIMHDVYIKIFHQAKSYKSQGKAMAWILRIARNTAYNALKKQKREYATFSNSKKQEERMYHDDKTLDNLILSEALKNLTIGERQIVILYLFSGISQKDISNITKIPLSTVKWRYKSALKKLTRILDNKTSLEEVSI